MNVIHVEKSKLLETLRANREQHARDCEDAKAGYLETAAEKLEEALDKIARGEVFPLHFGLTVPECHLDEYDRAIQMLEWHIADEIEVTVDDFARYVQDDWDWKERWKVTNVGYLSKVRG